MRRIGLMLPLYEMDSGVYEIADFGCEMTEGGYGYSCDSKVSFNCRSANLEAERVKVRLLRMSAKISCCLLMFTLYI